MDKHGCSLQGYYVLMYYIVFFHLGIQAEILAFHLSCAHFRQHFGEISVSQFWPTRQWLYWLQQELWHCWHYRAISLDCVAGIHPALGFMAAAFDHRTFYGFKCLAFLACSLRPLLSLLDFFWKCFQQTISSSEGGRFCLCFVCGKICLWPKDRSGGLLRCRCRQGRFLDVQGHQSIKCMSKNKISGHYFLDDAVASVAKPACIEFTNNKTPHACCCCLLSCAVLLQAL